MASDYLGLKVLLDGIHQAQTSGITLNFESGAQRVDTLEGLAGKTPGAKSIDLNLTYAVPRAGPEFDPIGSAARGDYHDVQIPIGDKSIITTGWVQRGSIGQSVNASTELTFTMTCTLEEPE